MNLSHREHCFVRSTVFVSAVPRVYDYLYNTTYYNLTLNKTLNKDFNCQILQCIVTFCRKQESEFL